MTLTLPDLLDASFGNRRGLKRALSTVGVTTWEQLAGAELGVQVLAAALTWHHSTTACDPVEPQVAMKLVQDLRKHLAHREGQAGELAVCVNGAHAAIVPAGTVWEPEGCTAPRCLYGLDDLLVMATVLA